MSAYPANSGIAATLGQWNAASEGWDAHSPVLRSWLSSATRLLFESAAVDSGQTVLDIAAGAGDQTLMLADKVGPRGRVVATDLSPALIDRLKLNTERAGLTTVEARVADAQEPLTETDVFDAAICRLGLMLMPAPLRCLSSVHAALKPGGRFSALVFAEPKDNPCIRILMSTALRHAGLPPRDPFAPGGLLSLGRPGQIEHLFEAAGFREVSAFRVDAPFRLPSARDYIAFVRSAAAPVIEVLSGLEAARREAAWQDMEGQLSAFDEPGGWAGPNTLLVAAGRT